MHRSTRGCHALKTASLELRPRQGCRVVGHISWKPLKEEEKVEEVEEEMTGEKEEREEKKVKE